MRFLLLSMLCALGLAAQAQLEVRTNRPLAQYSVGEAAQFLVTSPQSGRIDWEVRLSLRTPVIASGSVQHNGGTTAIPYLSPHPAFVTFAARLNGQYDAETATFSKHRLDALAQEPADFDAFWQNQKDQLAAVPLDIQIYLQQRNTYSSTYAFNLAQVDGRRVYGYVVVPDGDGPFPATLRLPAFGRGANLTTPDVAGAERGNALAVSVNIHNNPPNQEAFDGYEPNVILEPETYYYRWAILGAVRAIDYIATRGDWNQRDLMVYGDSQGGGLSILVAGIDGRPNAVLASTAALSQHAGLRFDRPAGFPYFLELANALYAPDQSLLDRAYAATGYYDAIFAARRFRGVSQHYVGYLDDICPPSTSYAAHNAMPGPKAMLHALDNGHRPPREFIEDRGEFMREHFPDARNPPFDFGSDARGYFVDAGPDRAVTTDSAIAMLPDFGEDQSASAAADWTAQWRVLEAPGPATFADVHTANTTVSFADSGRYVLELELTDPYPEQPRKYWTLTDRLVVNVTPAADTSTVDTLDSSVRSVPLDLAGLRVSPNPATAHTQLSATLGARADVRSYALLDARGRVLREVALPQSARATELTERIELAGLPAGEYVVQLRGPSGQAAVPLLKL